MSEAGIKITFTAEARKEAHILLEKIREENGMPCPRHLIDLPSDKEHRFHPNSFVPRKFLENMQGWVKKELRPLFLIPPPDVAGYESNGYYRRAVTWEMVMERRRERQREQLERKRSNYDLIERKPLYVWVFWCPGISGCFRGLWTYFVGFGHDYRGGGFKGNVKGELMDELLRLFPLVEPNLFGTDWEILEKWMKRFVKKYHRGTRSGKPQGKALVWAEVEGSRVLRILGKAEWPKKRQYE